MAIALTRGRAADIKPLQIRQSSFGKAMELAYSNDWFINKMGQKIKSDKNLALYFEPRKDCVYRSFINLHYKLKSIYNFLFNGVFYIVDNFQEVFCKCY